jgi:hypothetical protein
VTNVVLFFPHIALNLRAPDDSDCVFHCRHLFSGDLRNHFGHFRFSRKTEIGRYIRIIYHRLCIRFAPGKAAASSLSPGQNIQHFFNLGIGLNGKLVRCKGKADTKEKAYTT